MFRRFEAINLNKQTHKKKIKTIEKFFKGYCFSVQGDKKNTAK